MISALLAVHNGADYLIESLDSVLAEAEVTEVIVVDDGSTDHTPAILSRYGTRVRVLRQEQSGQSRALNRAIAAASGDILAFQDADDLWPAGRTAVLLSEMTEKTDVVYGRMEQFLSPDLQPGEGSKIRLNRSDRAVPLLTNSLVRSEAFRRTGALDEQLRTGAAIDWLSRARAQGLRFSTTETVTLLRRIHAANLGRTVRPVDRNADLLGILHRHVARSRTNAGAEPD